MWDGSFRHVSPDDEFIVYPLMDKVCNSRRLVDRKLAGETGAQVQKMTTFYFSTKVKINDLATLKYFF